MSLGSKILKVKGFQGFVVCEDEKGKFIFSESEVELVPIEPQFKKRCFLTSPRRRLPLREGSS